MEPDPYGLALERVRCVSAEHVARHADALSWRADVDQVLGLVWLPGGWATEPAQVDLRKVLLSGRIRRHLNAISRRPERAWSLRANHAANERLALPIALEHVFSAPSTQHSALSTLYLTHTPLGQPCVRWRGAAEGARTQGPQPGNLHISFSHDGEAHLTLAAYAPGLRGAGIDVVHLPRLRRGGKDRAYLCRFARHFMSHEEFAAFEAAGAQDDDESLRRRVAAHFSLMEAASKALGTGLRIGGGIGSAASLPKESLNIMALSPEPVFAPGKEAMQRCATLRARQLKGYWAADVEYLVSVVLLWE